MRISNWKRKLAASLLAGGLISPASARAANLNTDLVVNGDFENVNLNVYGQYAGPLVLNWTGPSLYAYSHDYSSTAGSGLENPNDPGEFFPNGVPDYAGGDTDPPNAGHWYFTNNNTGQVGAPNDPPNTDVHDPNGYYQDIDVSTGATGAAIALGRGRVDLSAYMSSYLNDTDYGNVRVTFRSSAGEDLGSTQISDTADAGAENEWNQTTGSGAIPPGTATLRVSLFGTRPPDSTFGAGADGYTDNVTAQVAQTVNAQFLVLEVNTVTGQTRIKNETGAAVHIDYYEITSTGGASLKPTTWTSLQDQNLAGFPSGNGAGNGWEEAGGISTAVLSESYLTNSSNVASAATIALGPVFNTAAAQDLKFRYSAVAPATLDSDFDADGDSDGRDFLAWQRGMGITTGATKAQGDANADGAVDTADYAIWKTEFGGSTFGGPGVVVPGVVRYVVASTQVPEPSTVILAGVGLAIVANLGSKKGRRAS